MTASTITFLVPGFLFFFVIQLAGAMEEISISQNSTLKNHTVSSLLLNTYFKNLTIALRFFNRSEKVLFVYLLLFL